MKEIDFYAGCTIDNAYQALQDYAKKNGPC